jgi:two-component system, NtrC family, sensor kinase
MNEREIANTINILLVDDEDDYRQVLAKRLSRRGIRSIEATTGEQALRLLEATPVDIIILDVKMPGMGGMQTLRVIKERFPMSEVIMLTGHANTQSGVEGIKCGAFDYLAKPIEIEHLIRKISQADNKIKRILAEKQASEFKERIKQQLVVAERLVALGTLATGVAHEINNPLAIIQQSAGWLQQILAKPEMSAIPRRADFEKALDRTQKAVQRAHRITRQLLAVCHTQSIEMPDPQNVVEVDLKALAQECVTLIAPEASLKKIKIIIDSVEPSPVARTDSFQLLQVLLNLLTNAVQATDAGGRITIVLRTSRQQAVQIAVQDTGHGISQENLSRVFEPFFTTKKVGQGTGMGLYVSWGIVAKLGGSIAVDSQEGKGSTFTLTLPIDLKLEQNGMAAKKEERGGIE